jgi:hypothetical protein
VTTFGPVTQISDHGPFMAGPRSIRKPDSSEELSVHDRLIWLEETATAFNELGAPTGAATRAGAANPENRIAMRIVLRVRPTSLNLPYRLSGAETFLDDVTESVLGSCGVRTSG